MEVMQERQAKTILSSIEKFTGDLMHEGQKNEGLPDDQVKDDQGMDALNSEGAGPTSTNGGEIDVAVDTEDKLEADDGSKNGELKLSSLQHYISAGSQNGGYGPMLHHNFLKVSIRSSQRHRRHRSRKLFPRNEKELD